MIFWKNHGSPAFRGMVSPCGRRLHRPRNCRGGLAHFRAARPPDQASARVSNRSSWKRTTSRRACPARFSAASWKSASRFRFSAVKRAPNPIFPRVWNLKSESGSYLLPERDVEVWDFAKPLALVLPHIFRRLFSKVVILDSPAQAERLGLDLAAVATVRCTPSSGRQFFPRLHRRRRAGFSRQGWGRAVSGRGERPVASGKVAFHAGIHRPGRRLRAGPAVDDRPALRRPAGGPELRDLRPDLDRRAGPAGRPRRHRQLRRRRGLYPQRPARRRRGRPGEGAGPQPGHGSRLRFAAHPARRRPGVAFQPRP